MSSIMPELNKKANNCMRELVNTLSDKVRVKLDDAAYDVMETYYNEYKPRYYKRTRNLKLNSYSNAVVSQNKNHKTGGYAKDVSITFSPDDMKDVYYESVWDGHRYNLTDTPVPKEHIFESSFLYGFHGLPYEGNSTSTSLLSFINDDNFIQNKSPYDNMRYEVDNITQWLNSKEVENYVDKKVNDFVHDAIDYIGKSMAASGIKID